MSTWAFASIGSDCGLCSGGAVFVWPPSAEWVQAVLGEPLPGFCLLAAMCFHPRNWCTSYSGEKKKTKLVLQKSVVPFIALTLHSVFYVF